MERIQAAVIGGRALTPRFKQRQLEALYQSLLKHRSVVEEAISTDLKCSPAEASAQYFLSCDAVKGFFENIDFDKVLEAEYSIAHGKNNASRKTAIGYVYIKADTQSLFYSSIVSTAAAIAAGNCVALEIQRTLSKVGAVLKELLPQALDTETFAVVEADSIDQEFKNEFGCYVDCQSKSNQRVVAVIDRTADLEKAAADLVKSRMSFAGTSTYAPDYVLVNEFCVDTFCKAAVQAALPYLTRNTGRSEKVTRSKAEKSQSSTLPVGLSFLSSGTGGSIALARDREAVLKADRISEPLLIVIPSSSMDDAIDFINESISEPLQALYTFGAPSFSKYMSQFVRSDISFSNHIPLEVLVGPAAPRLPCIGTSTAVNSLAPRVHPRFTPDMFSVPVPEYIEPSHSPLSAHLEDLLSNSSETRAAAVSKLTKAIQKAPFREPNKGAIGYFEQGIITGGSILLSTIVVGTTCAVKYGYPFLARVLKSRLLS